MFTDEPMAEWIKVQEKIIRDPVVMEQSDALKLDPRIIAWSWVTLWNWARETTGTGFVGRITPSRIDSIVGITGFAQHAGEWLLFRDGGVEFPNWDRHNSDGAKERAMTARRNKRHRQNKNDEGGERSERHARDGDTVSRVTVEASPEEKRREEKREEDTPQPPAESLGFLAFWQAWPKHKRKEDKAGCARKWARMNLEPLTTVIVADVNRRKLSTDWTKDGGEYISAPMVYLNKRRWENEDGGAAPARRAMGVD